MDKQYSSLEQRLYDELWASMDVFKKAKPKYSPTRFMEMLREYHAVKTAKRLLQDRKEPAEFTGLNKLWELENVNKIPNALSCSLEAIIYNNEEYRSLFTEAEIDVCRERLEKLGYFEKHPY